MSKLSFRARALDASKPMPILMAEELPDLPDYSAINRAVPQMPSGMEKEEECEHHLQRAICTGIIIPTPEVSDIPDKEAYEKMYPANYKQPRPYIHMQPFTMEQDITDYDMDSEDERWLVSQAQRLELDPAKFEEMMDRLEKSSGQTVVTLHEAKALLKEDDDLIIAVYDYWLNKRLRLQHPLILTVKTEQRAGTAANNPYLAFRRRTEKMQTRKNRKNDETSYEKMLKLKRDLCRAVTLLELVKRREKLKREHVNLTVEVFEKRYQTRDFSGALVAEMAALRSSRPAFTPIFQNHYGNTGWSNKAILKDEIIPRKEKRQYKKRKHKSLTHSRGGVTGCLEGTMSSDEETVPQVSPEPEEVEEEGQFVFRRNKHCSYHMPIPYEGNWPWCSREDNGPADKRYRYTLTSLSNPRRCIGFARRRVGRGGRIILDRAHHDLDDFWRTVDFTIYEPTATKKEEEVEKVGGSVGVCEDRLRTSIEGVKNEIKAEVNGVKKEEEEDEDQDVVEFLKTVRKEWLHFRPKTPPPNYSPPCSMLPSDYPATFAPTSGAPFSMEVQVLNQVPSIVLDPSSSYVAGPFEFDLDLDPTTMSTPEVPITDTRQRDDVQATTTSNNNTLNCSVSNEDDGDVTRTVCCSRFRVSDECSLSSSSSVVEKRQSSAAIVSSTLTSPKLNNSVNVVAEQQRRAGDAMTHGNAGGNGLLSQFGLDGSPNCKTKNNKIPYAYSSGVGYANAASAGTLSLHTSAHTLTLNRHSANILEIPLSNDTEKVPVKAVNQTEGNGASPNSKNKTMVRKNNIVMEVT